MPKPTRFTTSITTTRPVQEIADTILDLSQWPLFTGYGPLPGIRSAAFEKQTPEAVGSIIRVTNTNNSTHTEEITEWDLPTTIQLRLSNFSRPLSLFASHFVETWRFEPEFALTHIKRGFELYPRSPLTRPSLWLIRPLLRRAIARANKALL